MILYKSTRGKDKNLYRFSEVVLKGMAEDGGLLVPQIIPQIALNQLEILAKKSYQERAEFICNLFETDFTEQTIKYIVNEAYRNNFDDKKIAPIHKLKENQYILELWHGPTSAFKDMALQIMPLFFSEAIRLNKLSSRYLILVATSGDTGKAALEGYKNKENILMSVFYPDKRVSTLQELQMVTQEGENLSVFALSGDFDVVQSTVKEIFADKEFNQTLLKKFNILLSSANSINWGRLMPQIIYYISAYSDLMKQQAIHPGQIIDVVVPTGNFGNILAAFYAKKMGLPLGRLICASNENHVLTEFLQTGIYDISKRKLVQTPSPSMDILIASNVERLLSLITKDEKKVSQWMVKLRQKGRFEVDEQTKKILQIEFAADWVSNTESLINIKKVSSQTGYLIDPHTSVAQLVAQRYSDKKIKKNPLLICSTAHFAKFAKDVHRAMELETKGSLSEFDMLNEIVKNLPNTTIPKNLSDLMTKPIIHNKKTQANKEIVEVELIKWIKKAIYN